MGPTGPSVLLCPYPPAAARRPVTPGNAATINRVLNVLEHKGVEFIDNGFRLTKRPRR